MTVLRIDTAVVTSVGGRSYNEDAWGTAQSGCASCWVVCDGAGGHGGGDVAARLAVDRALNAWRDTSRGKADAQPLHQAVVAADLAVNQGQRMSAEVADMRTTIAMLSLDLEHGCAAWAHVGDTRVYHFQRGELRERTRDHSLVEQLLQAGLAEGDPSRCHPRRNVLTAALGGGIAASTTDVAELRGPLEAGDAFLLCTDGFWEYVLEADMESALETAQPAASILARLEEMLRARARSGNDNYTAVLVEVLGHGG